MLLTMLLGTLTLAFNIGTASNASPETFLCLTPSTIRVRVGDHFSINVTLEDVADFFGFEFYLGYNTTLLDTLNVVIHPPFVDFIETNETGGYVHIAAMLPPDSPPTYGSFPLASITFNSTSLGDCPLHLYNTSLVNLDSNPIPHITIDGSVTVYSGIFNSSRQLPNDTGCC